MKHLHRDYHTAHCGLDASYIPMTFEASEVDCEACLTAYAAFQVELAAEAEERARVQAAVKANAAAK